MVARTYRLLNQEEPRHCSPRMSLDLGCSLEASCTPQAIAVVAKAAASAI